MRSCSALLDAEEEEENEDEDEDEEENEDEEEDEEETPLRPLAKAELALAVGDFFERGGAALRLSSSPLRLRCRLSCSSLTTSFATLMSDIFSVAPALSVVVFLLYLSG